MSHVLSMANEEELKMWNELKLGYTESQGEDEATDSSSVSHDKFLHDIYSAVQPGFLIELRSLIQGWSS